MISKSLEGTCLQKPSYLTQGVAEPSYKTASSGGRKIPIGRVPRLADNCHLFLCSFEKKPALAWKHPAEILQSFFAIGSTNHERFTIA